MLSSLYGDASKARKDSGDIFSKGGKPAGGSGSGNGYPVAPPKAPTAALQRLAAAGVSLGASSQPGTASPPKADSITKDADTTWNVDDEYDPAKPNDYDEICKQRARKRTEEDLKKRQDDLVQRKAQADKPAEEPVVQSSFAMKMMKKMGWKEGSGLGKNEQGMAAPLIAQKTDSNVARIVESQVKPKAKPMVAASGVRFPTRILLLLNLVGKGEVDDELEEETADEARKFGTVVGCKIVEVPTAADDCAVRIFLHFEDIDGAQKAQKDLNGRYFGGRVVRCSFYPEHRFFGGDLHPGLDE